jgi:hypothetical protein
MSSTSAVVSGSLSGLGAGQSFTPVVVVNGSRFLPTTFGYFNVSVAGTFVATYQIMRSIDGGLTYAPISNLGNALFLQHP